MELISISECTQRRIRVFFDSGVVIQLRREPNGEEAARRTMRQCLEIPPALRWYGLPTHLELLYKHSLPRDERKATRELLNRYQIKYLTSRESTDRIARQLLDAVHFEPPDDKPLDLLQAALPLDYGGALATTNRKHFEGVPRLLVVSNFEQS